MCKKKGNLENFGKMHGSGKWHQFKKFHFGVEIRESRWTATDRRACGAPEWREYGNGLAAAGIVFWIIHGSHEFNVLLWFGNFSLFLGDDSLKKLPSHSSSCHPSSQKVSFDVWPCLLYNSVHKDIDFHLRWYDRIQLNSNSLKCIKSGCQTLGNAWRRHEPTLIQWMDAPLCLV